MINKQNQYVILAAITLLAAVLRFYKLGEWSFWGDEMFTVGGREDGFNYSFLRQSISLSLIQWVVALVGVSEWNARLVPAVVGILSIPVLFFLVRKMFGTGVGLAAALLLAVSPWHLYWSQNARFYVPLLLFYTVALLLFYLGLEEDKPWYLLASFVFLGLAVKERLLTLFFLPVAVSYIVVLLLPGMDRPAGLRWRNLSIFLIPGLVLGLLFVWPYINNFSGWMEGFGYVNNNPLWLAAGIVYYISLPTICVAFLAGVYFLTAEVEAKRRRATIILGLSAVLPCLMIIAISPFHYTANRYAFVALTGWIILAAAGAVELINRSPNSLKILAGTALALLVLAPMGENALYYKYQNGNRDDWKGALEWVKARRQPGDLVFSANRELGDHYLQAESIALSRFDPDEITDTGATVWFVEDMVAEEVFYDTHEWLLNHTKLVANFDVHANARTFTMRVYLYEPTQSLQHIAQ